MKKSSWIALGAALAFGAFVAHAFFSVQPIEVVASRLDRDSNGVHVTARLRNTGDQPRALDMEVHYYDANGRPLGADTIAIKRLDAGATADFSSPPHQIAAVKDFSIYLNNGRNPYGN